MTDILIRAFIPLYIGGMLLTIISVALHFG